MRALRNIPPCSAASTLSTPKSIDHLYDLWERFLYFFNYFENRKNLFFFSPICFLFNYIFNHKILGAQRLQRSRVGEEILASANALLRFFFNQSPWNRFPE